MHAIAVWTAVKHALSFTSPTASQALTLPATGEEILRCLTLRKCSPNQRPLPTAMALPPQAPRQRRNLKLALRDHNPQFLCGKLAIE